MVLLLFYHDGASGLSNITNGPAFASQHLPSRYGRYYTPPHGACPARLWHLGKAVHYVHGVVEGDAADSLIRAACRLIAA